MRELDFTVSAGPTTASARTLAALGAPITYHYDPTFLRDFREAERKVQEVFRTRSDVILLQGEAVLGLEAGARGLVRSGDVCLSLVSGVFGKGLGQRLRAAGGQVLELEVPFDMAIEPDAVERVLEERGDVKVIALVHCETPSGTLNPLSEIASIANSYEVLTLVDCVSSLGGVPVEPDEWGLDICVAGPQKCLAGPVAPTLVTISPRAWAAIESNPEAPRGSYLSLLDWKERWLEGGMFPFTPLVSDVRALAVACDELLEEGLDASFARHEGAALACRSGARAAGLELWPRSETIASPTVTAIRIPEGLSDVQVRSHARERYGVMLSGSQGAGSLVRIGHMGVTARGLHPVIGLAALCRTLLDLGAEVNLGAGLEAALSIVSATEETEQARGEAQLGKAGAR